MVLFEKRADVVPFVYARSYERSQLIEISYPVMHQKYCLLNRRPEEESRFLNCAKPFSWEVFKCIYFNFSVNPRICWMYFGYDFILLCSSFVFDAFIRFYYFMLYRFFLSNWNISYFVMIHWYSLVKVWEGLLVTFVVIVPVVIYLIYKAQKSDKSIQEEKHLKRRFFKNVSKAAFIMISRGKSNWFYQNSERHISRI